MLAATKATRYSTISARYFPRPSPGGSLSCARVLRTERGGIMDVGVGVVVVDPDTDPEGRRALAGAG